MSEVKQYGHTWIQAVWKWDTLLTLIGFFPKGGGENFARIKAVFILFGFLKIFYWHNSIYDNGLRP